MRLPGRVDDLAAHETALLHFLHEPIDLLGVVEFVDDPLVVGDVAVDEVKAARDDLQLVHYLLQLERHQL
jgi:hypothetical protein